MSVSSTSPYKREYSSSSLTRPTQSSMRKDINNYVLCKKSRNAKPIYVSPDDSKKTLKSRAITPVPLRKKPLLTGSQTNPRRHPSLKRTESVRSNLFKTLPKSPAPAEKAQMPAFKKPGASLISPTRTAVHASPSTSSLASPPKPSTPGVSPISYNEPPTPYVNPNLPQKPKPPLKVLTASPNPAPTPYVSPEIPVPKKRGIVLIHLTPPSQKGNAISPSTNPDVPSHSKNEQTPKRFMTEVKAGSMVKHPSATIKPTQLSFTSPSPLRLTPSTPWKSRQATLPKHQRGHMENPLFEEIYILAQQVKKSTLQDSTTQDKKLKDKENRIQLPNSTESS